MFSPLGTTSIGSSLGCRVVLNGPGVQPHHCTLYRKESGEVTLVAEKSSRVLVDGRKVSDETCLSQGSMLTVGKSNYLRFNNPAEAELLRSTIGNEEHISMPHIDFTLDSTSSGGSSANNSPADVMMKSDPVFNSQNASILETVRKAEFPNNINNFHSPKVFAADSITVNTPAKDVLGSKFNNFTKNLTHMFANNKGVPNITNNNLTPTNTAHSQITTNISNQPSATFGLTKVNNTSPNPLPMLASPKIQQFSACYDRYPKPGSYGSLQVFPMNTVNSEMNTTVPTNAVLLSPQHSPKPSITELQRQRAQIERIQEQEVSKREHERLDEILKMCADFELENQDLPSSTVLPSPVVQNRIKTNGSLPRDHGLKCLSFENGSNGQLPTKPKSGYENVQISAGNHVQINDTKLSPPSGYENITSPKKPGYVPQSPRNRIKTCVSPKKEVPTQKMVEYNLLVQSFEEKLLMEINLLREDKLMNNRQMTNATVVESNNETTAVGTSSSTPGSSEKRKINVNNLKLILKKDTDIKQCEQLRADRKIILEQMREIKAKMSDIQRQEEEVIREVSNQTLLFV